MQHQQQPLPQPQFSPQFFDPNNGGWISTEGVKSYWDSNGQQFHITPANNYLPGQVPGGGSQPRGGVGSQQPPQPSQPTPTSTPPGIHGDMSKQPLQPAYIMARPVNPMYQQQRPTMQQTQQMRNHGRQIQNFIPNVGQIMAPSPTQLMQQQYYMYSNPVRQGAPPYSNQVLVAPQFFSHNPQYYPMQAQLPQYQTNIQSGGPSPQAQTPQTSVALMRQPVVAPIPQPPARHDNKKRSKAVKIINPDTNEEVQVDENSTNNNNVTPTRSNDSSARETPQPGPPQPEHSVAAEFAAKVAATMDPQSRSQSPVPESVPLDNVSDSDVTHKQPPIVPISSERVCSTLSTTSEEFVPRSHTMQSMPPSELAIEQPRPQEIVPTVSADIDSPPIDIQRPPTATKNASASSTAVVQPSLKSTSKKQKVSESEQQASTTPLPQPQPDVVKDNRKGQKEPAPKEKRDKTRSAMPEPSSVTITPEEVPNTPEVTIPPAASKEIKVQESVETSDIKAQQQNGEAPDTEATPTSVTVSAAVPLQTESNKTSKRQSGKKSGNKMRDLNRRGTEKEGSEMDAFTTEPVIMSDEKELQQTPISSPPPTPPPVVPEPVDKIQEDLEEKEDKLVAAKNEENTKVSALNRPEPEPSSVVEEKQPPQLTLRFTYPKDQWSPLNPEGKKKYDRQFLIDLRSDPMCNKKPDKLPDVVVQVGMLKHISNNKKSQSFNVDNRTDSLLPQFAHSQRGGGMVPKRGSQQGNKKGGSRLIQMSLSLNEEVKLTTTDNAWKPSRVEGSVKKTDDEKETEELKKNVRGILNKLTPQKFDKLMVKFAALPINSEEKLVEVIGLIFDKAVDEPGFSKSYAQMCNLCSKMEVKKDEGERVNFKKLIITRCQNEFQKNKAAELDAEKWHLDINSCSDPEKRKEMQLAYEEKERMIRMKSVGNIRFIGELFKLGMLTPKIMYGCIDELLSNPAEESLECLCKLLTTIGKDLEFPPKPQQQQPQQSGQNPPKQQATPTQILNTFFQKMADLSQKKGNSKVSSRVRFMLQDVIDLRGNKWVPRREDNNPKTIEQINKDAERESLENALAMNQPPRMNRQNDRADNRKRNQNDPDGWNTVGGHRNYSKFSTNTVFDTSRLQIQNLNKQDDLNSFTFGSSQNYRFTTGGAKDLKTNNSTFTSSNAFSALQPRGEERKPPQPNMNNRRMTPTPSIERQRMLTGTKDSNSYERSSRENSLQREKESPASQQNPGAYSTHSQKDKEKPSQISDKDYEKRRERWQENVFNEILGGLCTAKEARVEVEQFLTKDNCMEFVLKALELGLERKPPAQRNIGLLITSLLDSDLYSTQVVNEQFGIIYENIEDYAIDIPKVWDLQAQIIAPVLVSQKMNFSHFRDAIRPLLKSNNSVKLLLPILNLLVAEKGDGFVRSIWDSSKVSLTDFLPPDVNVDSFVEEKSLKYLTGEPPKITMDQVQDEILKLIQSGQSFEKILDFIKVNVGDKVKDISFIRALVTAFCEACITGPNNCDLNKDMFKKHEKLIERFVDHKEDRELACLSAVHLLSSKLQHPKGLVLNIFQEFLGDRLICSDSFIKWKDDKHETLENKGVSVFALASFFQALEEADTDDENS